MLFFFFSVFQVSVANVICFSLFCFVLIEQFILTFQVKRMTIYGRKNSRIAITRCGLLYLSTQAKLLRPNVFFFSGELQRIETKCSGNNFYRRNKTFNVLRGKKETHTPANSNFSSTRSFFSLAFSFVRVAHVNTLTCFGVLNGGGSTICIIKLHTANDSILVFFFWTGMPYAWKCAVVKRTDPFLRENKTYVYCLYAKLNETKKIEK